MTPEFVLHIAQQAIQIALLLTAVMLIPALAVGVLVSMFQAATQINEQTLSFIPKLFITFLTLLVAGPWMLSMIVGFAKKIIHDIPVVLGH